MNITKNFPPLIVLAAFFAVVLLIQTGYSFNIKTPHAEINIESPYK
jgi:hypothetical protein